MASLKDLFGTAGQEEKQGAGSAPNAPSMNSNNTSVAGAGSGFGPVKSGGAKQGSGQFTNLQTTQAANEKSRQQLSDRLQGGIGQQAQDLKQTAQDKASQFQQSADASKQQTQNLVQQARSLGNKGANVLESDIQSLTSGVKGMSAPSDMGALNSLSGNYDKLSRQASNLGTSAGQIQNLRSLFGAQGRGGSALDQAMLSGTDFSQARKDVLGAGLGVRDAVQTGQAASSQMARNRQDVENEAMQAGGKIQSALDETGGAELQRRKDALSRIQAQLDGTAGPGGVSMEDLELVGIDPNTAIGFSSKDQLKKALDAQTLGNLTGQNFLNDDQFKALRAAQGLAGTALTDEGLQRTGFDLFNEGAVQNVTRKDTDLGNYDRAGYEQALLNKLQNDYNTNVAQNNSNWAGKSSGTKYGGISEVGLLSKAREPGGIGRLNEIEQQLTNGSVELKDRYGRPTPAADYLASLRQAKQIYAMEQAQRADIAGNAKSATVRNFAGDNATLRSFFGV